MITTYHLGEICGAVTAEVTWYFAFGSVACKSYSFAERVAMKHKIDVSNPNKVTSNLFDCLQYLDEFYVYIKV